ncbi:predicted protein, partial [Nematostella vectensis]
CLAVHMSYATPQEGARLMFETIKKYFNEVLLAFPAESLKEQDLENVQHDVFLASRLGMGGAYVGGAKYISMIDRHLSTKGQSRPIVVLGNAGSGKSCLLSNWITAHQLRHPTDRALYGEDAIQTDAGAAERYVNIANTLACLYVDTEQFDKADTMHREVLHIKEKFAEKWERGAYYLAVGYNGLGVLNYRQNKFKE